MAFSHVTDPTSLCHYKHKTNRGSAAWKDLKRAAEEKSGETSVRSVAREYKETEHETEEIY